MNGFDCCSYGMIEHALQIGTQLRPFDDWLKSLGRSTATGWRWRRRGWLRVINIGGRLYLPAEEAGRFLQRAEAGEFSAAITRPSKEPTNG